jgi:hypothetical protein
MVSPIDYTMDVLSPIEGYMQGLKFGEGIQTGRLNRELLQSQEGREQEKFAIAKQDNGRISVQTMTDGTTRVVDTATNTALTGEAAAQAIEAAEEASAAARGNIKKQEGTGTLEAKIELGGEAAAKEAAAKIAQDLSVKAFTSINSIYQNIANLNDVKRLIGEGANTGRIVELLPDWNQATIELRNVQGKLGLDVVGSVTFGALNKSELDLALSIGLPTGLDEGALNKWVDRKIAAQQKLAGYLSKQAKFLSDPKNNLNDWLKKIEKESSTSAAENKTFVEQMTAKVKKGERLTQAETDRLTVIAKGGE